MKYFYLFTLCFGILVHYYVRNYFILNIYDLNYKVLPDSAVLYMLIADQNFSLFGSNSVGSYILYYVELYKLPVILPFLVTWFAVVKLNSAPFTKIVLLILIASPITSPLFIGINKELFLFLGSLAYVHYLNGHKISYFVLATICMGMSRISYLPVFLCAHLFFLIYSRINWPGRFAALILVGYTNFLLHSKLNHIVNRDNGDEGGALQSIFDQINSELILAPISVFAKLISLLSALPYKSITDFKLFDPDVIYIDLFLTGFGMAFIFFTLLFVLLIIRKSFRLNYSTKFSTLLMSHSAIFLLLPVTQYRYFIPLFLFFQLIFTEARGKTNEKKYHI